MLSAAASMVSAAEKLRNYKGAPFIVFVVLRGPTKNQKSSRAQCLRRLHGNLNEKARKNGGHQVSVSPASMRTQQKNKMSKKDIA